MNRNHPSLLVILTLNPLSFVILSETKNLITFKVNSAKNLMVFRAGSVKGTNLAHVLKAQGDEKSAIDMSQICDIDLM